MPRRHPQNIMTNPTAELENKLEATKHKSANWNAMLESVMHATAGEKTKQARMDLNIRLKSTRP